MDSSLATPAAAGATAPRTLDDAPVGAPQSERRFAFAFGGSGSEYFRIWIVNLLLTLVTLGIYYPWAKVRKLRYFHGNTTLAGHPFDFHAEPKRMLRGYALVGVLFVAYSVAGSFSLEAGLIAFVVIAGLWPALFRASMRFRLANTSWRGLRFAFAGSAGGAYKAWSPVLALLVLLVAGVTLADSEVLAGRARSNAIMLAAALAAIPMLALSVLAPLFWWLIKRYQHDHYRFASLRTRFDGRAGGFYKLFFKAGLVTLLAFVVFGVLGVLAVAALPALGSIGGDPRWLGRMMPVGMVAGYAAVAVAAQSYLVSRMQNLVWSSTSARALRIESDLRYAPLLGLTLKNWLLVLLTLGLYWPFAAVATARMRLEAVSIVTTRDLDSLVATQRERADDATGDAAGDLFDIDLGL